MDVVLNCDKPVNIDTIEPSIDMMTEDEIMKYSIQENDGQQLNVDNCSDEFDSSLDCEDIEEMETAWQRRCQLFDKTKEPNNSRDSFDDDTSMEGNYSSLSSNDDASNEHGMIQQQCQVIPEEEVYQQKQKQQSTDHQRVLLSNEDKLPSQNKHYISSYGRRVCIPRCGFCK